MKRFIIRLLVFAVLWLGYLYEHFQHASKLPAILFISACAISAYFFLPITKRPLLLFIFIDCLLLLEESLHPLANNMYILLMFLYLYVEAIFQLNVSAFRIFAAITFSCSAVVTLLWQPNESEWLIAFAIFSAIAIVLNEYVKEREEQKEMYEQLLGEYRRLKRSYYETERAARLEERTRIARDIHDSVGHKLTALLMQLEMLSIRERKEEYKQLQALVRESLEETRQAVKALQTEENAGISSVLQLIRKLESESHIMVHFTTKQGALTAKLTNEQNIALYRVIQEGLTNAMRHAQSREVFVTLGKSAVGDLEFSIKNRVAHPKLFQLGFGLTNMQERIKQIGGTVHIFQTDSEFTVQGTIPIKEG
ncbi:signal transduction histidine kinase [Anoxybacillus voinovskiensis]|uniref:histidine kinase n=1 Tax=Anoxybacteroides voinovskiense TaxID=230470 RepID=A0A840DLA0_9BACL|nr:sensor histidine kinase [Anoxybacillus voinovskiensis]MBB4072483.1 signal transduction histidine kinase [Anoxybacillus voinovskiensis]